MNSENRIQRSALGQLSKIGSGAQGQVYSTSAELKYFLGSLVYKEYFPAVHQDMDVSILAAMPAYLESISRAKAVEMMSRFAWPCRLVEESNQVTGFVMPAIPDAFFTTMQSVTGPSRVIGEFQHLLNSESFLTRRKISLTDQLRYKLLKEVAIGLTILHRHQIAVGDFSPKNLLFSITPSVRVFFIDCDSMRFRGKSVTYQVETPSWGIYVVNPEEPLATPATDAYKFGLLALRLFAGDQTTRDITSCPTRVVEPVRDLIEKALTKSPTQRPTPESWIRTLQAAAGPLSQNPPRPSIAQESSWGFGPKISKVQPQRETVPPTSKGAEKTPVAAPNTGSRKRSKKDSGTTLQSKSTQDRNKTDDSIPMLTVILITLILLCFFAMLNS